MGVIAITAFVNGVPLDADELNTAFDTVKNAINGSLDGDNIDTIPETDVVFNNTGHAHGGDADGEKVPEANVIFNDAAGHAHSGVGNDGKIIDEAGLPYAVNNGAKGALRLESGTKNINDDASATVTFASEFDEIPSIDVTYDRGGSFNETNYGYGIYVDGGPDIGYYIYDVSTTGFKIKNDVESNRDFHWRAIGIGEP